jgi:(1->4)-alpha-D-glucan 1-alpha-D-glucosylmutase
MSPGRAGANVARDAVPRATYRLQLNAGFTFNDATALIPYLAGLGISHVYCSPYFRARPGSMHGYDVVDHNALNPELGTRADFERFVATLAVHDMSHILDFVPNHVGIMGADNRWWLDLLENGKASPHAAFFDIDWSPPNPVLADKLLVPALGEPYGTVLERGDLQLACDSARGSLAVHYFEHCMPLDPRTYPLVLQRAAGRLNEGQTGRSELLELSAAFGQLPDRDCCTAEQARERSAGQTLLKRSLATLLAQFATLRTALEAAIALLNGRPGEPASYDGLHELLERQCYRLAYWRVASDDINYRRFFDVNDLAALRMEDDTVFDATHGLVLELIRDGKLGGLRIDHPDGLYDPEQYFTKLQRCARQAREHADARAPPADGLPLYLLVEKILAGFERLPRSWPVHGTTGYNFANVVNGVFVDARNKSRLDRVYRTFTGDYLEWEETSYESKVLVLRSMLAAELNVLANQLARIAQADRHTRDFTLSSLRQMLIEIIGNFPVYRTYVSGSEPESDRHYIDWAIGRTRVRNSAGSEPLLQFIRSMMLGDVTGVHPAMYPHGRREGHRGHGDVPLHAPGLAERGGRRAGELRNQRPPVPCRCAQPRPLLAPRNAGHLDA